MTEVKNETITNVIDNTSVKEASAHLSELAGVVHDHLRAADRDTRTILATMVAFVKAMLKNPSSLVEFVALAKSRKITFPFTVSTLGELVPTGVQSNMWLHISRVLIGRTDETQRWVPDEYFAKNLPGAARELATFAEDDVAGLLNVIETVKATKGKKTIGGIQALVQRDRAKHAAPRKTAMTDLPVSIPSHVLRARPVATVKLTERDLFPVDEMGFGLALVRFDEETGEMNILFGAADTSEVERIGATAWEAHKGKVNTSRSVRFVELTPASAGAKVAA
ncbi:hypothetical protein ACQKGL_02090 [Ensifer adhaerens]|uniref:hypothetical protein n=1 Tax=Ensifer adhaerens TaxID=106592 RepID=UPI003D03DE44